MSASLAGSLSYIWPVSHARSVESWVKDLFFEYDKPYCDNKACYAPESQVPC